MAYPSVSQFRWILLQIVGGIKNLTGDQFPVIIKMNCQDFLRGGCTVTDAVQTGAMLSKAGIVTVIKIFNGCICNKSKR